MKSKNKVVAMLALIAVIAMPAIQGCKKYADGPMLSFHSKAERVANTWKVDNYKINGSDYTSLVVGYVETFSKDGNYSYSWGSTHGTGVWAFQNKNAEIRITGIDHQSSETLFILKLEEKQFWYYYMDGNDRMEFHMVQN
jgi:hypothetical protein